MDKLNMIVVYGGAKFYTDAPLEITDTHVRFSDSWREMWIPRKNVKRIVMSGKYV